MSLSSLLLESEMLPSHEHKLSWDSVRNQIRLRSFTGVVKANEGQMPHIYTQIRVINDGEEHPYLST